MGVDRSLARLALAAGVMAIAADSAFIVFVVVGEPFGSVNDLGNATFAILAGWLAWRLRDRSGTLLAGLALTGAGIAVLGSWLVLSQSTGWLLAGLVSAVGFALIGPSVVAVGRSMANEGRWPRGLARLAVLTGALMVVGLVTIPAIALRIDDDATAPGWIWIGFLGWAGAFVLYPAWAIWLNRLADRERATAAAA